MIKLLSTIPLLLTLHPPLPIVLPPDILAQQYPNTHIHWEIAIIISKLPQHQKNRKTWKLMIKLLSTIPLSPTIFPLFPQKSSTQCPGFTVSKSPYSLINFNLHATFATAKKTEKAKNYKLMIKLLSNTPLPPTINPPYPNMIPPDLLALQSPTHHICWEIEINISKSPQTPKNQENFDWCPRHWWPWCCWWWCWWCIQRYWIWWCLVRL